MTDIPTFSTPLTATAFNANVDALCVSRELQVRRDTRQIWLQEAGRLRIKDQSREQNRQSRATGARACLNAQQVQSGPEKMHTV